MALDIGEVILRKARKGRSKMHGEKRILIIIQHDFIYRKFKTL